MNEKTYGLRHKEKGYLITVDESGNGGADFCNSTTVAFSADNGERIYETTNILNAVCSLVNVTEWYNSDSDKPENKGRDMSGYEVVEIERLVKPVPVKLPISLDSVAAFIYDVKKKDKNYVDGAKYGIVLREGVTVSIGDVINRNIGNDLLEVVNLGTERDSQAVAILRPVGVDKILGN